MSADIVFRLRRMWPYCPICMEYMPQDEGNICLDCGSILERRDVYHDVKTGFKRVEYREAKKYWTDRLFKMDKQGVPHLKVHRAWFTVGFPRYSVPRLETDITKIDLLTDEDGYARTYAIHVANVEEVKP